MARKIVVFLVLLCASLAWGQYTTSYVHSRGDLTTSASTVNLWKAFNGTQICKANTLVSAFDGNAWCIGTDSYPYQFNVNSHAWTKQTAMGTASVQITVLAGTVVWALQSQPSCNGFNPAQYGIYSWNGASWTQPNTSKCSSFLRVAGDGTLFSIEANQISWSTNAGVSYTWLQGSISYVSPFSKDIACAVNTSGKIFFFDPTTNKFVQGPTQPTGTAVSCIDAPGMGLSQTSATNNVALLSLNSAGSVQLLNNSTGVFGSVTGLTASSLVGFHKGYVLALDSAGHPYHWNVLAPLVSGTTSGTWNSGCPGPGHVCSPSATHTLNLQVKFSSGHGVNAGAGMQSTTGPWNSALNVYTWDINPGCDPEFGIPADPECVVEDAGDDICNESGQGIGAPGDIPQEGLSHDYQAYVADYPGGSFGPVPVGTWWGGSQKVITSDACIGSIPTCASDAYGVVMYFLDPSEKVVLYKMENMQMFSPWLMEVPYVTSPTLGTECFYDDGITIPTFQDIIVGVCD